MFQAPTTTAFYHHSNKKNGNSAKGLFGNLSIIPATLLSGYFQQPTTTTSPPPQEKLTTTTSFIEQPFFNDLIISPTVPTAPTAPQQPTHTNRRTQRRITQKQQNSVSATIAATASQRVMTTSNIGNISPSPSKSSAAAASSSSSSSPSPSPSSSSSSPINNNHHHHRRKKNSNKINRKKVDEAITLSAYAVEEDNQGNHDVAIGYYLNAIENMLEALPIHTNQARRDALKNKLRDFMDREGLTDDFMESTNASSAAKAAERNKDKSGNNTNGISENIINVAITSAVALKQSPIPDAISATLNYTMKKIKNIDQTYGLQDKAWEISRTGINLALEIDQQYNVHEKVGNALFTGIAAAMKAGIAYKDSPSYREIRKMKSEFQNAGNNKGESLL